MRRTTLVAIALVVGFALPAAAATVRVKANHTPLLSAPSGEGEVVARLSQGALLELVDVIPDWYKVRDPKTRQEGFVLASLVELLPGQFADAVAGRVAKPAGPVRQALPPKAGQWRDAGYVSLTGGVQTLGSKFSYSFSPAEFAYAEQARIEARFSPRTGPAGEFEVGFRLWGNLAIGAAASAYSKRLPVDLAGSVPHPLYLDRDRAVSGTTSSLRTEIALHLQAAIVVPLGRRGIVSIGAGPSYIQVEQSLPTGVNLETVYPYDTTSLTGVQATTAKRGDVGFNAGIEMGWFFSRRFGVGGVARFSRAAVRMPIPGGLARTDAGGLTAGLGLRMRLGPASPASRRRGPVKPPPRHRQSNRISRLTGRQSAQPTGPGQVRKTRVVSDRDRSSAAAS